MTASRDPDRMIHAFLREGEEELQDQVYDAVRAEIERKPQRAGFGLWRTPIMTKIVGFGLAAVAVIAAVFIGVQLLGSPGGMGSGATPTPQPTATAEPSRSPISAPPLTQTFTSTQHGLSLAYPEGWTAQAATGPWTEPTFPLEFGQPHADWLSDPVLTHNLFLAIASQPIGDSTPENWIAEQMAAGDDVGCPESEPVTVDGASGLIGAGECNVVAVTTEGRGYWIQLYTSDDDPAAVASYDKAWFEEVLATVQLSPEDAVD